MNSDELRAIGAMGCGLLLIGFGVFMLLANNYLDSPQVQLVVGSGYICGGIACFVYGFGFLFRPGEPGPAEEKKWGRFKIVGVVFAWLGVALMFLAAVLILVQT